MKAVIQRVLSACVRVDREIVGKVDKGLLVLLGVMEGDGEKEAETMASKTAKLRIFEDSDEKMNLSVLDVEGEILSVSQFTLCADVKKGNRPSFTPSAEPSEAKRLYEYFNECLKKEGVKSVETGIFAADMKVELINDGPVTIIFDTDTWIKK
ncbi:MAG: D-tyrosyl-tRNA(Tyr) deacylase [Ruminococcaceae bacterium]|nr:D-tyrosyl-tRNA(Tyr) deacylase [Oscillospiraceae bacterium]MBR3598026.1 D-tyrosyl-tRNA(Tyr) deacylase [Clostridia bacterium]